MRHKNEIPQDKEQWQGHSFVVVNFWPHDQKVPMHDGRTLRPTAICTACGVTHWRGRKTGTFGRKGEDGKRRGYIVPSNCGEAYLPYGTVPTWRKGRIVEVQMATCAPQPTAEVEAALKRLRAEDQIMDVIARRQEEASNAYEAQWERVTAVCAELMTPLVPAMIKAARSASAKAAVQAKRSKVAK